MGRVEKKRIADSLKVAGCFLVLALCWLPCQAVPRPESARTPAQNQAWDLFVSGTALIQEKKPFKARKQLEDAQKLWPQSAPIHYNLGFCYHDCGLYEQSIAEFKEALRLDPKLAGCYTNIANSYQQLGKTQDAIDWLQNALKNNPGDPGADQVRGLIGALQHAQAEQVLSDPAAPDYLPSICRNGRPQRWPLSKIPLRVFFANGTDDTGKPVKGFKQEYLYILKDALDAWMDASGNRLSYVAVGDHKTANIICTWTDDLEFPRQTNNKAEQGLAHVIYRDPGQGIKDIDQVQLTVLVLDRRHAKPLADDEMKTVCLHELGHALGLNGHSPNNRDVMFFSMAPSVWPALTKRDKSTLLRLYEDYPQRQLLQAQP